MGTHVGATSHRKTCACTGRKLQKHVKTHSRTHGQQTFAATHRQSAKPTRTPSEAEWRQEGRIGMRWNIPQLRTRRLHAITLVRIILSSVSPVQRPGRQVTSSTDAHVGQICHGMFWAPSSGRGYVPVGRRSGRGQGTSGRVLATLSLHLDDGHVVTVL